MAGAGQPPPAPDILSRVAEQAELLAQKAPLVLTRETLEQRATVLRPPRIRIGKAATEPLKPQGKVRTIVSEYTVAPLKGSASKDLLEFRQVISVDGHPVQSAESARHALSLGVQSPDDRERKRMLEDFAHYGLQDLGTDYAMILLAFTNRGQEDMLILPSGEERIGGDNALVFSWQQRSPAKGELLFDGSQAARLPLAGKLWVGKSDGLPLRVWVWAIRQSSKRSIRDEATVDYVMSPHGFMAPVSVHHQHIVDGQTTTENLFRYEPFKLFGADSEIKFSPAPGSPSPAPSQPPP
ncbi:MAG: hypothetical protein ABSC23_09765 [Bryobacteraceae bacterium]